MRGADEQPGSLAERSRCITVPHMATGTRDGEQSPLLVATSDLPQSPGYPFYVRLNAVLDAHHFDRFVEQLSQRFYASVMGRPSLTPGRYFRLLLLGYFEARQTSCWSSTRITTCQTGWRTSAT